MMDQRGQSVGSPTSFHQVLIILFGALFFSPGSGEPLAERVEDAVSDSTRQERAVVAAKAIDGAVDQTVGAVIRGHGEYYRAIGGAGADETLVRGKIEEIIERLAESEQGQLRLRGDLRDQLEPSERAEVFDGSGDGVRWGPRAAGPRATGSHRAAAREAAVRRPRSGSACGPWPARGNPRAWPGRSATARPPGGPRRRGRRARCWSPP